MALDDFRRWLDVGARGGREGAMALELTTEGKLRVLIDPPKPADMAWIDLDYSDAGQLLDWLREGLGVLLARQGDPVATAALAGLQLARDTPRVQR